jgi:hypothetical protein
MAHIEISLITARTQEAAPRQIFTKIRFCPLANLEGRGSGGASPGLYLAPKSRHRKAVYLSQEPFASTMYFFRGTPELQGSSRNTLPRLSPP